MLQETGGEQRLLGIWVASGEGEAILILMSGIDVPHPLTFNFAINLLEAAGGQLRSARQSGSAKRFSRRTVQMEPAAPLRPMATMPAFLTHLGVAA